MKNVVRKYWAQAFNNGDFFCIDTYSGLGCVGRDPEGVQHLLPNNASNLDLGLALVDALSKSRMLTREQFSELLALDKANASYIEWTQALINHYGYKSKSSLFKNMNCCIVMSTSEQIKIKPMNHEKLEDWSGDGIEIDDYVIIPASSAPEEVGSALQLAFSRCIN